MSGGAPPCSQCQVPKRLVDGKWKCTHPQHVEVVRGVRLRKGVRAGARMVTGK